MQVALCPKPYSHDWGACPYAHEKENARRRDPLKFQYSSCICPNSGKGAECSNGLACQYSHTVSHLLCTGNATLPVPSSSQDSLCIMVVLLWLSTAAAETAVPGSQHNRYWPILIQCVPACVPSIVQLFEYWLHPMRYRTQMCRSGAGCNRSLCFFAHSQAELRAPCQPLVLLQRQQQEQQQQQTQIPPMGYGSLAAAAAGVRPVVNGYNVQLRNDVNGWPLTADQGQGSSGNQRSVLLGTAPNQLGSAQNVLYTLGSANDMSTSSSGNSSSGAVMLVPGQGVVPATSMISIPAQPQQQQAGLTPSEYLLLQHHQWQQGPQVTPSQLNTLQLQLQQPQQQISMQGMPQMSALPTTSMAGSYISIPATETAGSSGGYVSSNGLFVQQYPQSYNLPLVGTAEVVSAVSGGMCMLRPGI